MKHYAKIQWQKQSAESFTDGKYHRGHQWQFDGGIHLKASSSPEVIPVPMSDASAVDPEEAFVAALCSCHMLFFLSIAAGKKYIVEEYTDAAEGIMNKDASGRMAMDQVVLNPVVKFSGNHFPDKQQLAAMHEQAHSRCFLANSVKTKIIIQHTQDE
ncbi:OsmC/Ohr family protein [Fulvivirga imtechensis AK7]|uniref:OsmC/Ohr family protein n=1 Tax=Fulvivirga imtechensis AK7 TaxID=1237149 RepID=L8JZI4_9BACT|nr:OsmC family protein [Fulvivirga imtechensis]ELR72607.1 OsmC/Ohr family protein [Fulvivirga imtechensis AK7]